MSSIKLSIFALASSAIASRHGHPYGAHKHLHPSGTGAAYATGSAGPYPYPHANGTGVWGSTGISKPSTPAGYSSSSAGTEHSTLYSTAHETVTVKQNYEASSALAASSTGAAPAGYGSSSSVADAGSGEQCTAVTYTYTERITATITEGQSMPASTHVSPVASSTAASAPGYSAPAYSSSSEISPVKSSASSASSYSAPAPSSSSDAPKAPGYSEGASSTTEAAAITTSPPSYSSSSPSDARVPLAYDAKKQDNKDASSAAAYSSVSSTKSAAASHSSSPSSPSSSGKRGLAYNDASLTTCFSGSREISWGYNWASDSGGLSGDYIFVPTLWGTGSEFVNSWSENAKAAISSGSTHLFSFNEPDHTAQANLGYADAAAAYAKYMNPFKGQAQLCAPSVTNGGGEMGLTWLKNFLAACTDCQIDCLNIHWYDSAENTEYFKSHIQEAAALAPGKPIYVSEFGAAGSDDQINSFLQEVMPWMDSNSEIAGYAYFMVDSGKLVSGTEPSTYGSTYMSYTA